MRNEREKNIYDQIHTDSLNNSQLHSKLLEIIWLLFHFSLQFVSPECGHFLFSLFCRLQPICTVVYMWLLKRYNNEPTERNENQQKKRNAWIVYQHSSQIHSCHNQRTKQNHKMIKLSLIQIVISFSMYTRN